MSKCKGFNINSPIFDEIFDRVRYTEIRVDNKKYAIEINKKKVNFDITDPRDWSDQMYIDVKFNQCDDDCSDCNLHRILIK